MRWSRTWRADPRSAAMADRHYNRKTIGAAQFSPPGRCVVLAHALAVWVTISNRPEYVDHAWPGAWVNTLFRNEGAGLSSELIAEACAATRWEWGDPPAAGLITFVDRSKVKAKRDPGYCYLRAGFDRIGETKGGHGRRPLIVLGLRAEKFPPPRRTFGRAVRLVPIGRGADVLSAFEIRRGDALTSLRELGAESVHCAITSPPYWGLRDYRAAGQIGLEDSPDRYIEKLVQVFREVRRVLRADGTLWLNLGDAYAQGGRGTPGGPASTLNGARWCRDEANRAMKARGESYRRPPPGLKPKDLIGLPFLLVFALRAEGWYWRQTNIWHKPNAMPESVRDRTTTAHEYLFTLSKSEHYFYDAEAIKEPVTEDDRTRRGTETRNKRSVWSINSAHGMDGHFATFPEDLVRPCIEAGTSRRGVCSKCGAPIVRRVKRTRTLDGAPTKLPAFRNTSKGEPSSAVGVGHHRIGTITRTLGWKPSCSCKAEAAPAVVLDPFSGTATTGAVALKLGRSYLGLELNPTYAEISERRLGGVAPLFTGRVA